MKAMTVEQARAITRPFYESLNRPREKDVSTLLAEACHDDYQSYHANSEYISREKLAAVFKSMGETIPDLKWDVADLHVLGDMIIVRGLRGEHRLPSSGAPLRPVGPSTRWRSTSSPPAPESS